MAKDYTQFRFTLEPVTKNSLLKWDLLKAMPTTLDDFNRSENYKRTYKIWMSDVHWITRLYKGMLSINKEQLRSDLIKITVSEKILHSDQTAMHSYDAIIHCSGKHLSSPIEWFTEYKVTDLVTDTVIVQASMSKTGKISSSSLDQKMNDKYFVSLPLPAGDVAASFSIIHALGNPNFRKNKTSAFIFLDRLDKIKRGHQLSHIGCEPLATGLANYNAEVFEHTGPGFQPVIYYVDSQTGCLLLSIAGDRLCHILSDSAEAEFEKNKTSIVNGALKKGEKP